MPAQKIDYENDPQYQVFAQEFIRTGGKINRAAEKAGLSAGAISNLKWYNLGFASWLAGLLESALVLAVAIQDARLLKAITDGKPLDTPSIRTGDQLYRRTDKIKPAQQIVNVHGSGPSAEDIEEGMERARRMDMKALEN